jgi:hypothetical protein
VPPESLVAGRVVVEFTDQPQDSSLPDMAQYRRGSVIRSATGQLAWDTAGQGFFAVNTPGTQALVGFAQGRQLAFDNVSLTLASPYASIFLTALGRGETLATAPRALLTAVARNCNTGFQYFALDGKVLDNGQTPILLEPVQATLTITGRSLAAVHVLNHDGRRTNKTVPIQNGQFTIDGARDAALYYEVEFR